MIINIENSKERKKTNQKLLFEIRRKLFHLSGIIFPASYYYLERELMTWIILALVVFIVLPDLVKHRIPQIIKMMHRYFGIFMRKSEKENTHKLNGASFMMIGLLITILLFEKNTVITSWLILIISDSFSSLIGMYLGKKLEEGKSVIGSLSFFTISVLICYLFLYNYQIEHLQYIDFFIIVITILFTTIIEFYSNIINIDDNILIPFSFCFFLKLLALLI